MCHPAKIECPFRELNFETPADKDIKFFFDLSHLPSILLVNFFIITLAGFFLTEIRTRQ